MDIWEAIEERRSTGKVKPDAVDRALIERMLDAAVMAPCHRMTQPWRFVVMTGEGRGRLGQAYMDIAGGDDEAQFKKAFRAPVVIAAVCAPSDRPMVHRAEEFAAVHAAVQNALLAAHALGLGAIWRSGDPMYHPTMKEAFELAPSEELVGFIYVGHPEVKPQPPKRTPASAFTTWIE